MTIQIFTTGGTIDKAYFDALSEYQFTQTIVPKLLEVGRVTLAHKVETLFQKDSLELTDNDRARIRAAVTASDSRGIVITHGTDTMTETAAALRGIEGKTIVLVGALSPARFAESDAPFNLGMALATAQIAPSGVYITMNGTVFDAFAVTKDRANGRFVSLEPSA
ncbi:asparaginase domain-containing protein [Sphingobium sp. DEHP117]|uniref:asparaginase n=1 Tax=Sphingobium sp. DEHP117 TaxID=2993436 RepID=UPI0027D585E7|nr:asparaginase domain-containing protein [Sphingobium sp. DEHP117]MDQ4419729.1 asparaginase domain-containing protein [Sphingobium sp. DEHP117]